MWQLEYSTDGKVKRKLTSMRHLWKICLFQVNFIKIQNMKIDKIYFNDLDIFHKKFFRFTLN